VRYRHTFDDLKIHLQKIARPTLLQRILKMLPGGATGASDWPPAGLKRMVGIIDSMTHAERHHPEILDYTRRIRITRGAGARAGEVKQLLWLLRACPMEL